MKINGREVISPSNGSSNGLDDLFNNQFLFKEELEVETIMGENMSNLSPLWDLIDPAILRFLGDVFPIGPMRSRDVVTLFITFDYMEKPRKPCEVYQAVKSEGMRNGHIWNLLWLLARIRGRPDLWERYVSSIALGSPVSDGCSDRRFPCICGTASHPSIRLISETSIGDPSRSFKYIGRPVDAPHLQMAKFSLS